MGRMVAFESNGKQAEGYLAAPSQRGPGVVVIQEWWGLVDHIKDVADRLATEGFVALAPDLFHGKTTREPDEAQKLMMNLQMGEAAKDMSGAVRYLQSLDEVEPKKVGSVGFCMGGALSVFLSTIAPVDAAVTYYGIPTAEPDYSAIKGPVLGHFAEHDDWGSPEAVADLAKKLESAGIDLTFHTYSGTEHAFFNDARPEVYKKDAAELSWERTIEFFRKYLA